VGISRGEKWDSYTPFGIKNKTVYNSPHPTEIYPQEERKGTMERTLINASSLPVLKRFPHTHTS
jgi:hypothetical protein